MFDLTSIEPANTRWIPPKIVLYGPRGIGKTSFSTTFEKPILFRAEDGAGAFDIPTFPEVATRFNDIINAIEALHGDHPHKTAIFDTLDWMEPLVWAHQIEQRPTDEKGNPVSNIEDYGWGKGFSFVDEWWRMIMGGLDSLRINKGMSILLIAHAEVKVYNSPTSDPYDRYQIKIHKRASELWQEWSDMTLFVNFKTIIKKAGKSDFNKKSRGEGLGERIIYTEERPAYIAKNRWDLPPEIYIGKDKTWSKFHECLSEATEGRYINPLKKGEK